MIESTLIDTQCSVVFVLAVALQTKFRSPANFEVILEYAKDMYTCFVDLQKAYDQIACEKICGVLREHSDDGRLLLAVKSLYS